MEGPATWPLRWRSAERANCSISLTTRITPTPTTLPPGRKSGSRPRDVSPTLSPAWGPPAPLPAYRAFLREQSKPVAIVGLQPEEGSSIPGSVAGRQSICRGSLTLRWWMRCWIFISRMPRIPCVSWRCGKAFSAGSVRAARWRARYALPVKILARWWWRSSAIAAIVTFHRRVRRRTF